jgi:DNA-binding NarL/FixJ family response regulator
VVSYEDGLLLVFNSGAIKLMTPFGLRPHLPILEKALQGTYVNHVLQLSDTRLAISTQTAGMFLYDMREKKLEQITTANGLAANACLRSFQDYYGNLWVGMQNGIALIHINSPMRILNQEINVQGSGYEAYETAQGLYFTTSNGIYFLGAESERCTFVPGTEGPAYGIHDIAGQYYAGHHTGLFILENGTARQIASINGLWGIKQLQANPQYAIGGTYEGLFLFKIKDQQVLEPVQPIAGFDLSSRFFEEDDQGNIWVGQYYQGLFRLTLSDDLTKATVMDMSDNPGFKDNRQTILSRADHDLFVATESGLFALDTEHQKMMQANRFADHIGEQPVFLFEQDRKNNIHVLTDRSVGFFKQISEGNYQYMPSSLYQLRYHLNNDLLHASVHTSRGILFSANEGFIQYDPNLEDPLKVQQPLVIKRVYSVTEDRVLFEQYPFDVRPEQLEQLVVSPGAKVIKIDVESFLFNDLDDASFRYFLKGFDDDFGAWTIAPTKEYTNLPAGNYEFIAQARNYLGETVTSQPLYFKVQPPFYNTTIAKVFYIFLGLVLLFLVSRLQRRRYKTKAQKMEEDKQLELAIKQQRLIEVEQQKERELQQLKEEKMQTELEHVNNLLAASTMNLAVKNEFIESIKEELEKVKQGGRKVETKRALEKIVKEIDITLRLQEDWEQFEYHFDKVHGDFLTRLRQEFPDLSPNEQKLCALLRLNLNTKEIANMLSISQRGVEVARYRLRKKLDLEKGQNLSKFILEY